MAIGGHRPINHSRGLVAAPTGSWVSTAVAPSGGLVFIVECDGPLERRPRPHRHSAARGRFQTPRRCTDGVAEPAEAVVGPSRPLPALRGLWQWRARPGLGRCPSGRARGVGLARCPQGCVSSTCGCQAWPAGTGGRLSGVRSSQRRPPQGHAARRLCDHW